MTANRFVELQQIIKTFKSNKDYNKLKISECERKIKDCESVLKQKRRLKKQGKGWFITEAIVLAVFAAASIYLKRIAFSSNATELIILIFALVVPLLVGIVTKVSGKVKYSNLTKPYGGKKRIYTTLRQMKEELESLKTNENSSVSASEYNSAKVELRGATVYRGRDWDLSSYTSTPDNIYALEKDAEELFVAIACNVLLGLSNSIISNNWIYRDAARCSPQNDDYFSWHERIRNSGNWKLMITSRVVYLFGLKYSVRMQCLLKGEKYTISKDSLFYGSSKYFLTSCSEYREPINEDERNFFSVADIAYTEMCYHL